MGLNTKQKLAVVAVVGGLATLPVVGAQIWNNNKAVNTTPVVTTQASGSNGSGYMTSSNNGATVVVAPQHTMSTTITPNNNAMGQGPAAHNGLTSQDMPANNYQGNDSMGQLIANNTGNNANNTMPTAGQSCEYSYSKDAIKAGVKHYRFQQANEATLVEVGGGHKLTPEAAAALKKLQAAAKADGVTLTVGSAFRSISYQQGIVARKKAAGQSDAQIYKVSSAPGYSEHHTGYALDFSPINNSFTNTKAYTWLRQHGNEYGWEQSFTPESTRDTKVAVESWHWKYKGSATAKAALANDVCYYR